MQQFFSSLFDALDGKVARITDSSSARGDLLDHVFDRYSDIFILGGITFSPYCPMEVGLACGGSPRLAFVEGADDRTAQVEGVHLALAPPEDTALGIDQ